MLTFEKEKVYNIPANNNETPTSEELLSSIGELLSMYEIYLQKENCVKQVTILNSNEIKLSYLQNLRIEKSANSITTKQYYFQPKTSIQNPEQWSQSPQAPTQTRTWMFKRID